MACKIRRTQCLGIALLSAHLQNLCKLSCSANTFGSYVLVVHSNIKTFCPENLFFLLRDRYQKRAVASEAVPDNWSQNSLFLSDGISRTVSRCLTYRPICHCGVSQIFLYCLPLKLERKYGTE